VDKHQIMREAVAHEYGFKLYRQYAEKEVCAFLKKDISTLKRWRRKGLIEFIRMGPKHIQYFGYQVADMLIKGVEEDGQVPEA
jgi:hypothetical protein